MPLPQFFDCFLAKVSVYPGIAIQQNVFSEALEFVSKPVIQRDPEALFGPLENVLVEFFLGDTFEKILGLILLKLQQW